MWIFVITDIENDPFMPNNETDLYHIRACLKGMRLPCPFHFHLQLTITLAFYFNFPPTNNFGDSPLDGNTRHCFLFNAGGLLAHINIKYAYLNH